MTTTKSPTRPVLRWHGGKWILAPWIISHFPEHRVYTEAYGGAGSVLLRKPSSYAEVYNDLDGDVVNLFRVLRDPEGGAMLKEQLKLTPFSRDEFKASYVRSEEPIERARKIVVRGFMSFGSDGCSRNKVSGGPMKTGFRATSNRLGTTPAHDWANYPECLNSIIKRLEGVVIENRPATEVILQHDSSDTLHYVDPPYVHSTRRIGNIASQQNYTVEMNDQDHAELSSALRSLKGMVVLSGYRCDLYDELYRGWHTVDRSALADGAKPRIETLWINDAAWSRMPQGVLL